MAEVLGSFLNGDVNLTLDNTLYLQQEFNFILDDDDDAIDILATGTELVIRGTVGSDSFSGININSGETNNSIVIATTGIVSGQTDGIFVNSDNNNITNNGKILGVDEGIDFQPNTSGNVLINFGEIVGQDGGIDTFLSTDVRIYNHGQIIGAGFVGVYLDGDGSLLRNTGEIASLSEAGVELDTESGETARVFNSGIISGTNLDGDAVVGDAGDETIINQGTIDGNVSLGAGNDLFNGTGGTVIGSVAGGAGDDEYIVDDPTLVLVEEADEGIDTVTADTGWTLGDNFENLNLAGDGDYTGVGNNLDNVINGNIGDNVLEGLGGNDSIFGGVGDDVIRGGGGDDQLAGNAGNDEIHGGIGDDDLAGGLGDDDLFGGVGNDKLNGALGDDLLVGGRGDDNMFAGFGEDVLIGGHGDDVLAGGFDGDVLVGGLGRDLLIGGEGADRFVYNSIQESPVGAANRDWINDFSSAQGDRINLAGIDADPSSGEDDSFTFIGTSAFSGSAGELGFVTVGNHVIVAGDTDGDGFADFQIFVANTTSLSAGDFIL